MGYDSHMILRQNKLCLYISDGLQMFYCENKISQFDFSEDSDGENRAYMIDDRGNGYLLQNGICVKNTQRKKQYDDPYWCYECTDLCIYSYLLKLEIPPDYKLLNEFKNIASGSMKDVRFTKYLKFEYSLCCDSDPLFTYEKFVSLVNEFSHFIGICQMNIKNYYLIQSSYIIRKFFCLSIDVSSTLNI